MYSLKKYNHYKVYFIKLYLILNNWLITEAVRQQFVSIHFSKKVFLIDSRIFTATIGNNNYLIKYSYLIIHIHIYSFGVLLCNA